MLDGIRRIVQALRESSRGTEKRVGLSAAQLFVLLKLAGERALSINELAARTLTHQSSVSVVVGRLVAAGMVVSTRSETDARRVEIALTRKGRAALSKAPEATQDRLIAAIAALPRPRRKALAEALELLADSMSPRGKTPRMLFEEPTETKRRNGRS
ncbi:MAG: MarR family winged helix-turn-helix transcriptional regulator [Polyangiales bacterium]